MITLSGTREEQSRAKENHRRVLQREDARVIKAYPPRECYVTTV